MIILGIDPGSVSGAYAAIDDNGRIAEVDDLPVVNRQVDAGALSRLVGWLAPGLAVVEDVHAMPRQGVSSTFKFGVSVGIIRGVLAGHEVPVLYVAPTRWKKWFRLDGEGEKSRELALRMWPSCRKLARKKDHGRAEALLMAHYGLRSGNS